MLFFKVTIISKSQSAQRTGRAGRTAQGKCFRLYTLEDYEKMKNVSTPAIHRTDFASTTLYLKGIPDKHIIVKQILERLLINVCSRSRI